MISMSMASIRRISEVLNEKPDLRDPAEPISEVPDGRIDFDHVSFSYKHGSGEDVLSDIDLHIKSGETIGVIGGTGSGKSSLVNLICRLYDVDEGAVRVGGIDVRELRHGGSAQSGRRRAAEEHPLLRHHPRQPALGQPGRHRGGVHRGLPRGLRRRVHRPHARRLQHPHRARRHQRLRRPEAAPVHRPRPAEEAPRCSSWMTPPAPWTPPPTPRSAHAFAESIPGTTKIIIAQRISSVEDADRILVHGQRPHQTPLTPMRTCSSPTPSTRRSTSPRSRAAATSTSPPERRMLKL